jgi:hypothetical protein
MKRSLVLIVMVFAAGCSSSNNGSGTSTPPTSMQGTWTATGNLSGSGSGSGTYQIALVPSPCSVITPLGTFSVQGPVCFIANNNSAQGSISGSGLPSSSNNIGQGVLIGVAANPVPANGTFNLLFVSAIGANFVEFTGNGTVTNGTMKGSGSCSASTSLCQGLSATFSGTEQ